MAIEFNSYILYKVEIRNLAICWLNSNIFSLNMNTNADSVVGYLAAAMTLRIAYFTADTANYTTPAILHIGGCVGMMFLFLPC